MTNVLSLKGWPPPVPPQILRESRAGRKVWAPANLICRCDAIRDQGTRPPSLIHSFSNERRTARTSKHRAEWSRG
ncbi:hypothetical protein PUN28_010758 [Cardiocondyla obscurior]|uniref:Uncharacterized protein n=1 Tax=Cardiocondyla obscurior TaxID=286306 RepID=A0AAW2FJ36_9HYME